MEHFDEYPGKVKGGGGKKGLISKTWERCKSLGAPRKVVALKSKSWPPDGCFSIYVGPEREKFTIKTEYVNHPLFKILLEEAECEYGYTCDGPLTLPCAVHHFIAVLTEMDDSDIHPLPMHGCTFVARRPHTASYHLLTPPRYIT